MVGYVGLFVDGGKRLADVTLAQMSNSLFGEIFFAIRIIGCVTNASAIPSSGGETHFADSLFVAMEL